MMRVLMEDDGGAMRFAVERIVAKPREAERRQGQGLTIPQVCERIGVTDQTFYRWRLKYGRPTGLRPGPRWPANCSDTTR